MGITPDGRYGSFRPVTIISVISWPVTVTRLIAESPPTFTVWQPSGPAFGRSSVDDGAGRGSSSLPESSVGTRVLIGDVRVGVGEEVMVGVGKVVRVGVGENVSVGVGEDVRTGVGEVVKVGVGEVVTAGVGVAVGVRAGVGEVVGTVVSGGATTVTYPGRLRALVTVRFRTVRFTVYIPGVSYT
jgi:hypothetical protein